MRKVFLILLVVLLSVAAYLYFSKSSGTIREEYKDFAISDTASITRIFISNQKNEKADLTRVGDAYWKINDGYRARQDAIDLLLETFHRIEVSSPVPQSAFETVVKQLATAGIKVEIYADDNEEPEKVYYVGAATDNHKGTYMLLELNGKKSSRPFITFIPGFYGYLSTRFFTEEHLWRDRALFPFDEDQIASVSLRYTGSPEKSFTVNKQDGQFSVTNNTGEEISPIDPITMQEYLRRYSSAHFEFINIDASEHEKDSVLSSDPMHIFEVTTTEGQKRQLKTYRKPIAETYDINTGELLPYDLDRCLGLIDGEEYVTLQYVTLDELLVTVQDIANANPVDK